MSEPLTIAIGKGRLLDESLALLERLDYDPAPVREARRERRMIASLPGLRVLLARDGDVPVYVEQGAADLGVAGRDILQERDADVLVPVLLGPLIPTSRCRLSLIAPRARQATNWRLVHDLRIATKYPRLTRRYVEAEGLGAQVITLGGNVELAPAAGLAELVVDVVQTGTTLRENDLIELDTLLESEAALIVNRATHKLRAAEIRDLIGRVERLID